MASPMIALRLHADTAAAWLTGLAAAIACVLVAACGEDAPPPIVALAAVPTVAVQTRDAVIVAAVPRDLVVTIQESSLFATSADGSFRLFLEHRPGESLPEVFGALKDELIGLGWEPGEEQHFESAVSVGMARGSKQHRLQRMTWILQAAGRVVVCEAIASELQALRLGTPLRDLCQGLKVGPPPAAPSPPVVTPPGPPVR